MHIMTSEKAPGGPSRRRHDRSFKAELIRQSLEPGASVSAIALQNGINANLLFNWRREHRRSNRLGPAPAVLLPVQVTPEVEAAAVGAPVVPAPLPAAKPSTRSGVIEMEIAGVQLRVRGVVDEASLCSVLRALRQTP
jgi:transposase